MTPLEAIMKSKIFCLLFLVVNAVVVPLTFAETPEPEEESFEDHVDSYWSRISDKFSFGVINFILGWTEIITEPVDHYQDHAGEKSRFAHAFVGVGEGMLNGILDTGGGALNAVTAPFPQFRIPLPENGIDVSRVTG
jgi:hypothetical protein